MSQAIKDGTKNTRGRKVIIVSIGIFILVCVLWVVLVVARGGWVVAPTNTTEGPLWQNTKEYIQNTWDDGSKNIGTILEEIQNVGSQATTTATSSE